MNEKLELRITGSYGMYTPAGNKSIENKFKTLIKKLEKEDITASGKVKAVESLVKAWRKMGSSETMGEASDTAVREAVFNTLTVVGEEFNVSYDVCDWVWGNTY